MSKKVLIITTSLRPNSNSDKLAESFAKGAEEAWVAVFGLGTEVLDDMSPAVEVYPVTVAA